MAIHTIVELSQCTVEVCGSSDQLLIFRQAENELLRMSFAEFDQLLEVVAKTENFIPD